MAYPVGLRGGGGGSRTRTGNVKRVLSPPRLPISPSLRSRRPDSNRQPAVYKTAALPLSYYGVPMCRGWRLAPPPSTMPPIPGRLENRWFAVVNSVAVFPTCHALPTPGRSLRGRTLRVGLEPTVYQFSATERELNPRVRKLVARCVARSGPYRAYFRCLSGEQLCRYRLVFVGCCLLVRITGRA